MDYQLEPVYVIKDEDGTLWNAETNDWDDGICGGCLFSDKDDAQAELDKYLADDFPNACVVEIGETGSNGTPVEVTEDEADFLQAVATSPYPFSEICRKMDALSKDDDSFLTFPKQSKLFRALKDGWEIKQKETRYVVFVPHTDHVANYRRFTDGTVYASIYVASVIEDNELFTQEEIDEQELDDCEKKEVKNNGNEHN